MRREEFIESVRNMDDLYEFLSDRSLTDMVYDHEFETGDYVEEMTNESLRDIVDGYDSWDSLRGALNDIGELSDWYSTRYGCNLLDAEPIDSDGSEFRDFKDEVLEYMDGHWDQYSEDEDWIDDEVSTELFDDDEDAEDVKEEFNAELLW